MGIFGSKERSSLRLIPPGDLADLPRIGRGAYRESRFEDVSRFYLPGLEATGFATPGSPEWSAFVDRFLEELLDAADREEWAIAGAFRVAADFLGSDVSNPRYVELVDRALLFLRDAGIPYTAVPPFALERWYDNYGMDGLRPKGWTVA